MGAAHQQQTRAVHLAGCPPPSNSSDVTGLHGHHGLDAWDQPARPGWAYSRKAALEHPAEIADGIAQPGSA